MADTHVEAHEQAERHDPVYDRLHATPEFQELKKRHTSFVLPGDDRVPGLVPAVRRDVELGDTTS